MCFPEAAHDSADQTLRSTSSWLKLEFNSEHKTISVFDTDIRMSKGDLINSFGTLAKSRAANFLEVGAEGGGANFIVQFGIGLYLLFRIADKVTVTS